jgi:hypothetical protein
VCLFGLAIGYVDLDDQAGLLLGVELRHQLGVVGPGLRRVQDLVAEAVDAAGVERVGALRVLDDADDEHEHGGVDQGRDFHGQAPPRWPSPSPRDVHQQHLHGHVYERDNPRYKML